MQSHLINKDATLREALDCLNALSGGNMTLFVVEADGTLTGSLTDGDIRRALTSGVSLEASVADVCHHTCLRLESEASRYDVGAEARRRGISLLPVIAEGKVVALEDLRGRKALLPLDAVLMAGGRGERLRPLTLTTPKPLLPVGGKAIIDYNVEALAAYGVRNIFITVNYLKEKIIAHFRDDFSMPDKLAGCSLNVECIEEPKRLGTMGSVALVDGLHCDDLLVMNSDLLTTIDFEKMFLYHKSSGAALTMAAVPYTVQVPFAILDHKDGYVSALSEKPTFSYLANAGIYMMRRRVAEQIPAGEYLDAPDLIETLISAGEKVASFPIEGTWIDIGSPDDYHTADRLASKNL